MEEGNRETKEESAKLLSLLLSKEITMLELVSELENKLVSHDLEDRDSAVVRLAEVVAWLPEDFLNDLEVITLFTFFAAKLQDTPLHSTWVLKAIHFLVRKCTAKPDALAMTLFRSLIKESQVQSLPVLDRFLIFDLIDWLLTEKLSEVQSLGAEFLLAFMQAMEGERDPRNLLIVYRLFCAIATDCSLGPFGADLFDVAACYFPIDFKPPLNDPYGITADQLSKALNQCLVAHPSFANICYDMLAEKMLEATSVGHKHECFRVWASAFVRFPPRVTAEYAPGIWHSIKDEVLAPPSDPSALRRHTSEQEACHHGLSEELLTAVEQLVRCLDANTDSSGHNTQLTALLDRILHDCEPFFKNAEMGLLVSTSTVLLRIAAVSPSIGRRLLGRVSDWLVAPLRNAAVGPTPISVVADWCQLTVDAPTPITGSADLPSVSTKRRIVELLAAQFDSADASPAVRRHALRLMSAFVRLPTTFPDDETCLRWCLRVLDHADVIDEKYRCEMMHFYRSVAEHRWPFCEQQILPLLKSLYDSHSMVPSLWAACIYDCLSASLLFDTLLDWTVLALRDCKTVSVGVLLDVFATMFASDTDRKWSNNYVSKCFGRLLTAIVARYHQQTAVVDLGDPCLEVLSTGIADISFVLPQEMAPLVLDVVLDCVEKHAESQVLFALEGFLCSILQTDGTTVFSRLGASLMELIKTSNAQGFVAYRILCSLLNKLPADNQTTFDTLHDKLMSAVENGGGNRIPMLGLLAKMLLLRNNRLLGTRHLRVLLSQLSPQERIGEDVDAMSVIVGCRYLLSYSSPDVQRQRLTTTVLYQQRIFCQIVPIYLEYYAATKFDDRLCFFAILGDLLNCAKNSGCEVEGVRSLSAVLVDALQFHSKRHVDGLVHSCVEINSLGLMFDALNGLLEAAGGRRVLDGNYFDNLIAVLLEFSDKKYSMDLRRRSADALALIPVRHQTDSLIRLKKKVVQVLTKSVDDRKRLVRMSAATARNRWYYI